MLFYDAQLFATSYFIHPYKYVYNTQNTKQQTLIYDLRTPPNQSIKLKSDAVVRTAYTIQFEMP